MDWSWPERRKWVVNMARISASNTGKITINMNRFEGGMATDFKNGIPNSYYDSEALDTRSIPSQMSLEPGLRTIVNNDVITDLIQSMTQDQNGVKWALGDKGNVYRFDEKTNIPTLVGTIPEDGGAGIIYNQMTDYIYVSGQQSISSYGPVTGYGGLNKTIQPTWQYNVFSKSADISAGVTNLYNNATTNYNWYGRNNLGINGGVGANSGVTSVSQVGANPQAGVTGSGIPAYTNVNIPNGIIDVGNNNFTSFMPGIEPFYSIAVYIVAKGTGNLTLTLHDGNNNVVATASLTNANITANSYNEFVFPAPGVRSYLSGIATGAESLYHFHVSSSAGVDTFTFRSIGSINMTYDSQGYPTNSTTADMQGIDFILFCSRLVKTHNKLHPITLFTGSNMFMCVGNGDYVSTWNMNTGSQPSNSAFNRMAVILDPGYEVCGFTTNNQYLVIAAERRRTTEDGRTEGGMLYFWDGVSQNYNMKSEIPQGAPYGIQTYQNVSFFTVNGSLYAITQVGTPAIKVRLIAYQDGNFTGEPDATQVYPSMLAVRDTDLLIGFPSVSHNPHVRYGVYSWGNVELSYPDSFSRTYMLNANQTHPTTWTPENDLHIGCVINFIDQLYVSFSYKDANGNRVCGMDYLDNSSPTATSASWASLIYDGGANYKQKEFLRYKLNFEPLPEGCSVSAWYAINRGQPVVKDDGGNPFVCNTKGATELVVETSKGRFHEIQWGLTITAPEGNMKPVVITGAVFELSPLNEEVAVARDAQGDSFTPLTGEARPQGSITYTDEDVL